jgi:hypothetical protein
MEDNLTEKETINIFKVEYLIISKEADTFCDNETTFINLLSSESKIKISEGNKTITFNNLQVNYTILTELIPSKSERFFKLELSSSNSSNLDEFENLTIILEKVVSKIHPEVSINILWNDIARNNAIKAYDILNKVENNLRRFIANFMLIKVGFEWPKSFVPEKVIKRNSIRSEINEVDQSNTIEGETNLSNKKESELKPINYTDYLYNTFFTDLITILFEGERDFKMRTMGDVEMLIKKYKSDNKNTVPISDLEGFIAKSLWDRHFSNILGEKKALESKLEKLTKFRNEVAHNKHIKSVELKEILGISKAVLSIIEKGTKSLEDITLTPEEQKIETEILNNKLDFNILNFYDVANKVKESSAYKNLLPYRFIHSSSVFSNCEYTILESKIDKSRIGIFIKYYNTSVESDLAIFEKDIFNFQMNNLPNEIILDKITHVHCFLVIETTKVGEELYINIDRTKLLLNKIQKQYNSTIFLFGQVNGNSFMLY